MNGLEGADCADLAPQVVDKYFNTAHPHDPFPIKVAKQICRRCVVLETCRQQAMQMTRLPEVGVIGGVTAAELNLARSWRSYEQGITEKIPRRPRPTWLAMTEATNLVEQLRLQDDPDE